MPSEGCAEHMTLSPERELILHLMGEFVTSREQHSHSGMSGLGTPVLKLTADIGSTTNLSSKLVSRVIKTVERLSQYTVPLTVVDTHARIWTLCKSFQTLPPDSPSSHLVTYADTLLGSAWSWSC